MRALLQPLYGEAHTLTMGDVPVPEPARGQVLVRVAAASVNAADVFLMRGVPRMVRLGHGLKRPARRRLGLDLAGVVAGVGLGVIRWKPGDLVFGQGIATFADCALAREHQLPPLPDGISPEHAAAVPVAGTTALRAVDVARVAPGQRVVVTGAAGGVGQFAAQLAALRGAEVIAVCSGRNIERVRSLGIEHVLDYETTSPLDTPIPYDTVIDNAGAVRIRDWRRVVALGGSILPNSGVPGPDGGALMRVPKGPVARAHRFAAGARLHGEGHRAGAHRAGPAARRATHLSAAGHYLPAGAGAAGAGRGGHPPRTGQNRHLHLVGGKALVMSRRSLPGSQWWIAAGLLALTLLPALGGITLLADLAGPATPERARFHSTPLPIAIHAVGGMVFCGLGAFQFLRGLRDRHPRYHWIAGRIVLPAGLAMALSGLWMTQMYDIVPEQSWPVRAVRLLFGSATAVGLVLALAAMPPRTSKPAWPRSYSPGPFARAGLSPSRKPQQLRMLKKMQRQPCWSSQAAI